MAVVLTRRPFHIVTTHAKIWTVVKRDIVMLPALKKLMAMPDIPTVNMWCSQTPKPTRPVSTVEIAT